MEESGDEGHSPVSREESHSSVSPEEGNSSEGDQSPVYQIERSPRLRYTSESGCVEIEQITVDNFENDGISRHIQSAFTGFSNEKPFDQSEEGNELMLLDLPDSILLKIFSNLSHPELCRIALVCKHWLWIVYDSELWKYVDFSQCANVTEQHLLNLIRNRLSPLLKMVDLSNCAVTPVLFQELTEKQNLETLVLKNSSFKQDEEEEENNMQLISAPDNLIRLDIRNFKAGFQFVHLILEVHSTSHLECFGFGNDTFCPTFKDFQNLLGKMRSLRILECVDCDSITDAQVRQVSEQLTVLESLVLKKCKNITGSSLGHLILSAENLKSLNLAGTMLNDLSVINAPWEICKIEELDLSFCDQLTADGLKDTLWKIKSLQYLAMNNTGRGRAVTAEIFQNAFLHDSWKDLTNLTLHFANRLTDEALSALKNCTKLKRISFRTCHKISFESICKALKDFPNLISLECGSLFPLDQTSSQWIDLIDSISTNCPNIKFLTMLKCAEVPIAKMSVYRSVVTRFVTTCVKLNSLSILYSEEAITRLFQDCATAMNRYPAVRISNSQNFTVMPPFRHSLDSEINKQKFQTFFGY